MTGTTLGTGADLGYTATITDLRRIPVTFIADGYALYVGGYKTEADGGGGVFSWDATSTAMDNGGTIIKPCAGDTMMESNADDTMMEPTTDDPMMEPTTDDPMMEPTTDDPMMDLPTDDPGRWLRNDTSLTSVRWFGATGDGVTDDAPAIQAALRTGKAVHLPAGTYVCEKPLEFENGQTITGDGIEKTIIKARHRMDILKPADISARYRGNVFSNFALMKEDEDDTPEGDKNEGHGDGLRLSNMRSAAVRQLKISRCDIGLDFRPERDADYSYFNEFTSLIIFNCKTNAVRTTVTDRTSETADFPNRNFWMSGDWRGGKVTLNIEHGGSQTFSGISIQGAGTNWAEVADSGATFVGCHFENPIASPLSPGQGVVFKAPGGKVIGGTASKGNMVPYIDPQTMMPETKIVANGQRYLELGPEVLRDGGFGVVSVPWIGEPGHTDSQVTGAGRRQNLFKQSNNQGRSVWTKTGDIRISACPSGGPGDSRFTKIEFGEDASGPPPGTSPSINYIFDETGKELPGTDALICFSVEIRADNNCEVRLDIDSFCEDGETKTSHDRTRTVIPVTTEWRRFWLSKQFQKYLLDDEGNVLVERDDEGNVPVERDDEGNVLTDDAGNPIPILIPIPIPGNVRVRVTSVANAEDLATIYTANWQLETGVTRPGVRTVTHRQPVEDVEWGIYADGMVGDFTSKGIATYVTDNMVLDSDPNLENSRKGMLVVGSEPNPVEENSTVSKLWVKCHDGCWRSVTLT